MLDAGVWGHSPQPLTKLKLCPSWSMYSSLNAYLDDTLCSTEFSESEWCKVPLAASDDFMLISAVYQPPNSNFGNFALL